MVTRLEIWMTEESGSYSLGMDRRYFSSPKHSNRLWGPPSLLPRGFQGLFRWCKSAGEKLLTRAEIKNAWNYTSAPLYVFMAWCLIKHRKKFTVAFVICDTGNSLLV
jgi:hypothetical protein